MSVNPQSRQQPVLELSERSDEEDFEVQRKTPKGVDTDSDVADISASDDSKQPELIHDISAIRKSGVN